MRILKTSYAPQHDSFRLFLFNLVCSHEWHASQEPPPALFRCSIFGIDLQASFSKTVFFAVIGFSSPKTHERPRKFVTQIHADLVFQACISFLGCFRPPVALITKILVYTGMLPCLVPSWPQIMQIRISFQSRSDLVLDADHALDSLSYLVLQACISFCSVPDKSGASLFFPCSHKNAVAHMIFSIGSCFGTNVMRLHGI